MRSHSRADFYTKTLAFLGLSGLAACAILVDHWPTSGNLPDVSFAVEGLRTPVVQTITDMPVLLPSSRTFTLTRATAPVPARAVLRPPRWAASFRPPDPRTESRPVPRLTQALPLESLASVLPSGELAPPPEPALVDTWQPMPAPAPVMTLASSEDGFLSSAWKKTSSSVSASLDKARTSLVDAVRVVGGAVPRILKR